MTESDSVSKDRPAPPSQNRAVVAVVSAWRGAGRTTIAVGIARAFARFGARVGLIGVDGTRDLDTHAVTPGVSTHIMRPADVQDAAAWSAALTELRTSHDLIVIDSAAGYRGTAGAVLANASHWLATIPVHGAWSGPVVAPEATPPSAAVRDLRPAGIVFNGFRAVPTTDLPAMRADDLERFVIDTVLPWSPWFANDADHERTAWLFDAIAHDIAPRLSAAPTGSPLARIPLRPFVSA